jgi:hypothetical protein
MRMKLWTTQCILFEIKKIYIYTKVIMIIFLTKWKLMVLSFGKVKNGFLIIFINKYERR